MTPTRGLPFELDPSGSDKLLHGVGLGIQRRFGKVGRHLDEPTPQRRRRRPPNPRPQRASTRRRGCASRPAATAAAAGPDMSMTASWARGRKPAASTAAPRSTWVVAAPHGHRRPQQPRKHATPAGPLRAGLDGIEHADDPHRVARGRAAQPDLGERRVAQEVEHALLADGQAPRFVARALAQVELAHLVDHPRQPGLRVHRPDPARCGGHRHTAAEARQACMIRLRSAFDVSGEVLQRGRHSRRMICGVDPVGHILGPDVDA